MLTIIDTSFTIHKVKIAIYSQDMINDLKKTEVFCPNCRLMNMWDSSEGAEQPDEVCTRLVGLPVETCAQLWIDSPLWRLQAPASSLQLAAGGPDQRRRRRRARHAAAAGLHLSPSASSVSLSCLSDAQTSAHLQHEDTFPCGEIKMKSSASHVGDITSSLCCA